MSDDHARIVLNRGRSCSVGTHQVSGHDVVMRPSTENINSVTVITGNDIALHNVKGIPAAVGSDTIGVSILNSHPLLRITQIQRATDIGSNQVPRHHVVTNIPAEQVHTVSVITRDQISFNRIADSVTVGPNPSKSRTFPDRHSVQGVSKILSPGDIRANIVSGHNGVI